MSDYQFVMDQIAARSLAQLRDLERRSNVPYPTILKVARGYTKNPKATTIEGLVRALRRERRRARKA